MYQSIKRLADIVISAICILILSPLLIPISIALRLTGEGYIFYRQERVGFKNKKFDIFKFATMLKNSPNMAGGLITTNRDPRLLPLGPFLRKTKINELPQLFNILLGDMSIVGPRPLMQKSFETYPKDVQDIVYKSKPGLTGIGSIVFRDEEELISKVKEAGGDTWAYYADTIYPHKGELEKWYFVHRGFWLDCKIIFATACAILFPNSQLVYRIFGDLPRRNF
jgi:lipopolysaccharide/colanic/teichoic acid biosynthesis glycosyltransferase